MEYKFKISTFKEVMTSLEKITKDTMHAIISDFLLIYPLITM